MSVLHLVDGTFELFRAYFAKTPDHVAPDDFPAKATVGVVRSMMRLLADPAEAVTHVAVAFDNPIESFRNDLFDGYKTGAGLPADLVANFDPVEKAVASLGIVVWRMERWEADDALATAAARWADAFDQVKLLSPDKDLGQCLDADRVVMVDRIRNRLIDEATFRARHGIAPASVPDWLALVGDDADGIPGLPGWGAKSAGAVLARYERLEGIPDRASTWQVPVRGAERLASTLRDRRPEAHLYRELATLVRDVPLPEDLDDLRWGGVPRDRFEPWCRSMGVPELLERPIRWT